MNPSTNTEDPKRAVATAAARRRVATADFYATLHQQLGAGLTQTEAARVLHTSQANVSRWAARGRELLERRRPGQPGSDPYEIAQRYATGEISRETMLDALGAWPYEPSPPAIDELDDIGIEPAGGFERTVGRAFDDGLLNDEDYDEIGRRLNARAAVLEDAPDAARR